ncbi:MAG: hypothetical protein GSR85_06960 [Desulfurococcales archaeon]|nr:hypothetical protein [Desulfurococcales archaeon]
MADVIVDPRWLAKVVSEIQGYKAMVAKLRQELCYEYYAPAGDCSNGLLSKSRELGRVYELLRDAEAILRDLESRYIKQLKAAVLAEMAREKAWELVKAAAAKEAG